MASLSVTASSVKLISGTKLFSAGTAGETPIEAGEAIVGVNASNQLNSRTGGRLFFGISSDLDQDFGEIFTGAGAESSDIPVFSIALATVAEGQLVPRASSGCVLDLGCTTVNNRMYFLAPDMGICPYTDLATGNKVILLGIGLPSNKFYFYPKDTGLLR